LDSRATDPLDVLDARACGNHPIISCRFGSIDDGGPVNDYRVVHNYIACPHAFAEVVFADEYKPVSRCDFSADDDSTTPSRRQRRPPAVTAPLTEDDP